MKQTKVQSSRWPLPFEYCQSLLMTSWCQVATPQTPAFIRASLHSGRGDLLFFGSHFERSRDPPATDGQESALFRGDSKNLSSTEEVLWNVISVHVACPSKIMSLTMTVPMSGEQDSNLQPLASKTSKQPPLSPQMCSTVRDVDPRDSQENPPLNSTATGHFMPAHKPG